MQTAIDHPKIFSLRPLVEKNKPKNVNVSDKFGLSWNPEIVGICTKGKMEFLHLKDIFLVQADSNYIKIYTINGASILLAKTLKRVSDKLSAAGFIRVHQSYMIHPRYIQKYNLRDSKITMHNRTEIPVSRSCRKLVADTLSGWAL